MTVPKPACALLSSTRNKDMVLSVVINGLIQTILDTNLRIVLLFGLQHYTLIYLIPRDDQASCLKKVRHVSLAP